MLLYHYAKTPYTTLKTLKQQGNLSRDERIAMEQAARFRKDIGPYYDHIAFFIEPIPLAFFPEIFPKDHKIWIRGQRVFEHTVAVDTLSLYGWSAVETPLSVFFAERLFLNEQLLYKWVYFRVKHFAALIAKERGKTHQSLVAYLHQFPLGSTRKAFLQLKTHHNKTLLQLYAATVPHLMIYVDKPIAVKDTRERVVGETPTQTKNFGQILHSTQWSS